MVLHSFNAQILTIKFISSLNWKLDQKSNFQSRLALIRHCKSRLGNKHGENMVFKSRELYYTVSMYNYYHLTLFLVLIGKFDQKSFHP